MCNGIMEQNSRGVHTSLENEKGQDNRTQLTAMLTVATHRVVKKYTP